MNNNIKLLILISLILISLGGYVVYSSNVEETIFDKIPYYYSSNLWIPPNSEVISSLGGYYSIWGQGRNFNFIIKLPGAENAESPLDYTKEGLNGTGTLKTIDITYNTLYDLYSGDVKKAMFDTKYSGDFEMKCAAWTGHGNFRSENGTIPGNFTINGAMTYWQGTFNVKYENNRIVLEMDYILHPQNDPSNVKNGKNVIYM